MSTDISNPPDQPDDDERKMQERTINIPFPESFIYSNVSAYSTSFMDIRIGFAEAMPDGTAQAKVGVVLPPEHAAHLVLSLLQQLHVFESNFGEIRHPQWRNFQKRAKLSAEAMKAQASGKPSATDEDPKSNLSQP